MPNRYIREDAIESEALNSVSWQAEVFYRRLLNRVDDFGRFTSNAALLRASLFPLQLERVSDAAVDQLLTECEGAGLLFPYIAEGKRLLVINKWEKGRATTSKYPPPPDEVCKRMQTFVYKRKQANANVPDSDSDSDSGSDTDSGSDPASDAGAGVGVGSGKCELQLRAEKLFNRRETTLWDKAETRAWKDAKAVVAATTPEQWAALEEFYAATETSDRPLYRRRNLATLLNNWSGETAKAIAWQTSRSEFERVW